MRLILLFVLGTLLALTVSGNTMAKPDIKLTAAGYVETQGIKSFVFGIDVRNVDNASLQVSPGDWQAVSDFGRYNLTGNTLKLDPGASGSLSLQANGVVSPKELVYKNGEKLSLQGRL